MTTMTESQRRCDGCRFPTRPRDQRTGEPEVYLECEQLPAEAPCKWGSYGPAYVEDDFGCAAWEALPAGESIPVEKYDPIPPYVPKWGRGREDGKRRRLCDEDGCAEEACMWCVDSLCVFCLEHSGFRRGLPLDEDRKWGGPGEE